MGNHTFSIRSYSHFHFPPASLRRVSVKKILLFCFFYSLKAYTLSDWLSFRLIVSQQRVFKSNWVQTYIHKTSIYDVLLLLPSRAVILNKAIVLFCWALPLDELWLGASTILDVFHFYSWVVISCYYYHGRGFIWWFSHYSHPEGIYGEGVCFYTRLWYSACSSVFISLPTLSSSRKT